MGLSHALTSAVREVYSLFETNFLQSCGFYHIILRVCVGGLSDAHTLALGGKVVCAVTEDD